MKTNPYYNAKHIARLIIQYLKRNEEEVSDEFVEWKKASEENESLLDSLLDGPTLYESLSFYDKVNPKKEWKLFQQRYNVSQQGKMIFMLKWVAAVAILISVGLTTYITIDKNKQELSLESSVRGEEFLPGRRKAVLSIGNEDIILTENTNLLHQEQTIVSDNQGAVLYSSGEKKEQLMQKIQVPKGGEYNVTLEDGTKVWLNADSEIRYPQKFRTDYREVFVKGEVYFEVAKKEGTPFYVNIDELKISVLGTSFVVNNYSNERDVTVSLLSGKVGMCLKDKQGEIELKPMQQFLLDKTTGGTSVEVFNPQSVLSWRSDKFIFDDETIPSIARKLERWYDVEIIVDEVLRSIRYSGVLERYKTLEPMVSILKSTDEIDVVELDSRKINIRSKEKK